LASSSPVSFIPAWRNYIPKVNIERLSEGCNSLVKNPKSTENCKLVWNDPGSEGSWIQKMIEERNPPKAV
jgi:hypothetical protein